MDGWCTNACKRFLVFCGRSVILIKFMDGYFYELTKYESAKETIPVTLCPVQGQYTYNVAVQAEVIRLPLDPE